jgi:L-lactate dehydrogenase complex protein LldF
MNSPTFPRSARDALADPQLRANLARATRTIREKRADVVSELPDWQDLREAGRGLKAHTMRHLDRYLVQLEKSVQRAGGTVHWARDAADANEIVTRVARSHSVESVVKVKSITTDEIGLNDSLAAAGIEPIETDLAELIIQLAEESSSHILVPAVHKNRSEIRELFRTRLGASDLSDDPAEITDVARLHLRKRFLKARMAVSGANFAVSETGSVVVVESEGNGRMCLSLPKVLVTVMGIEKVIPRWTDLEILLQLLPRSSTGERMNPYTSVWTGTAPGDGPQEFHLVLLDNGRTRALADPVGRQALHCIRCSACLNVCPVYSRTGGHAYNSVYPGPIGAILTPQLVESKNSDSLPYASSLCGACYEVCPVKIDIPKVLVHLRGGVAQRKSWLAPEALAIRALTLVFSRRNRYERAQKLARTGQWPLTRDGSIRRLPPPLSAWTQVRDAPAIPDQTFREWWKSSR